MMTRTLLLVITFSIVAPLSTAHSAFAQQTQDPTDVLFQEILRETAPRTKEIQPGSEIPAETLPAVRRQLQPSRLTTNTPPIVSPRNWNSLQNPQHNPISANPIATAPRSETQSTANTGQNVLSSIDSISVNLIAPKDINLNQKAVIRIQLKNLGKQLVDDVKFIATLPEHVRFEASRPIPTNVSEGRLEFDTIRLTSQSQTFIEIDVVPTRKAPMNIGTQLQYINKNQIAIAVREPALELQVNGPQELILGDTKEYLITVVNRGDGIANDLRFTSEFPEGLQKLRANNTVIPQLAPGQSAQISVTAQSLSSGQKNVKFMLASTELDPISRQTAITVLQPELELTATGPSVNFLRRDGIYRIEIANPGRVDCNNVEVDLAIPAEMNVSTISREANYNEATRQLTWSFPEISAGKTEVIQLKAQFVSEGEHSCGIMVRSNQTVAKEFRLNTMVATRADVSINLSNNSGPVQLGATAAFEVVVENKGSRSAEQVEINVSLPEALAPSAGEGYEINQFDNSIKFAVGEIQPGQKKTFRFDAIGSVQGEHVVRSQLSVAGSERKIIAEDSVYVFETDQSRVGQRLEPQIRRR